AGWRVAGLHLLRWELALLTSSLLLLDFLLYLSVGEVEREALFHDEFGEAREITGRVTGSRIRGLGLDGLHVCHFETFADEEVMFGLPVGNHRVVHHERAFGEGPHADTL